MGSSFSQSRYILILFLTVTICTSLVISRILLEECTSERHEKWMAQYGKVYKDDAEKLKRFQIFKDNVEFIESFNAAGNKPFNLSINKFADLRDEEFKALLSNGRKKVHRLETTLKTTSFKYANLTMIPATMDWRKRGAVTPIKNQGLCNGCWAFAAAAAVEGVHKIATGELVSLSAQELIDCVRGSSKGCNEGNANDAFQFIINEGISKETYYPYKGIDGSCNANRKTDVVHIKGYENVPENNENALLQAVANQPVSVYLDARGSAFRFYSSGIFTGECGTDVNHVATVVGYGEAPDGTKYWIVKNSWGNGWGEEGYIRMKRDIGAKKGLCAIASFPSYPTA